MQTEVIGLQRKFHGQMFEAMQALESARCLLNEIENHGVQHGATALRSSVTTLQGLVAIIDAEIGLVESIVLEVCHGR